MFRRSKRKSGFEDLMHRVGLWGFAVLALLAAVTLLVSEQPLVAGVVGVVIVAVPIAWFVLRRSARRRDTRLNVERAQHLGQLLTASGEEFETITADLFRTLGYTDVERIGRSGDLGVDLRATSPQGFSVIVQCKRYGRGQKIGSPAIQALMGAVVHNGAAEGIFVTTSTFTEPAVRHAESGRIRIRLIDGSELTRLATAASARSA